MTLSEFETKKCEKAVEAFMKKRRPPEHIRDQLDLRYRIKGQSIEIFEIRPDWRDSAAKREEPTAKATYVRTQGLWKVYWQRADLKLHRYDPEPGVTRIEDFLRIVDVDEYCCFFG